MANKCNQHLREMADASALKQSVIPVLICDDKLLVASKSIGATKQLKRPAVNGSAAPYISDEANRAIADESVNALCTLFNAEYGPSYAIITKGCANSEKYRAFIIEPQIIFLPSADAWYMTEVFENLGAAVTELLCTPAAQISRLELCCLRVSRLCSFASASSYASRTELRCDLETIISECAAPLKLIGGNASLRDIHEIGILTYCASEQIYMLTTSVLVAVVPMSQEGNVDISCDYDSSSGTVKVSHTIKTSREYRAPINSIDELIRIVPHLSLELAALKDMTSHCKIEFDCKTENDKLTVFYRIYAEKTTRVKFSTASIEEEAGRYIRKLLGELCELVKLESL